MILYIYIYIYEEVIVLCILITFTYSSFQDVVGVLGEVKNETFNVGIEEFSAWETDIWSACWSLRNRFKPLVNQLMGTGFPRMPSLYVRVRVTIRTMHETPIKRTQLRTTIPMSHSHAFLGVHRFYLHALHQCSKPSYILTCYGNPCFYTCINYKLRNPYF